MDNLFDIKQSINGDAVIGFTSAKAMKTKGYIDYSTVASYLMGDDESSYKKHLGMIDLFQTTHNVAIPFMRGLFEGAAVLECKEEEAITYDLPVNRAEQKCVTMEDTSGVHEFPGIDEGIFEIVLNRQFAKGDILSYDPQYGQQMIVSDQHEVIPVGENFKHFVQYSTTDRSKAFPKDKLKPGISYTKVGHVLPEYGTSYSTITMLQDASGSITCEFLLGAPRGVESFMTAKAARMEVPGLNSFADDSRKYIEKGLKAMGGDARSMFFIGNLNANGKVSKRSMRIGATLEYLGLLELQMMEAHSLLFAKAAIVRGSNGNKRVNEGVWHQIRRGKKIQYAKPGGITKQHIHEAASYIFKNSSIMPKDRRLKFKGGYFAYMNVLELFSAEAIQQSNDLPSVMLGTDAQIGKVFSGSLDALEMNAVQIRTVTFPGIGKVEVEHDETLDYQPLSDRFSQGMFGESKAHTSHSLVIWDATNPEYSNVNDKVKGASLVKGGNKMSNMYYVKPEGMPNVTYGYEQGRMANGESGANIASSIRYMGKQFWAWNQSAALVLDTTRYIVIELDHPEA